LEDAHLTGAGFEITPGVDFADPYHPQNDVVELSARQRKITRKIYTGQLVINPGINKHVTLNAPIPVAIFPTFVV